MGVLFKLLYLSSFVMKQQWFFFPPEAFFSQNTECQTAKAHLQEIHCTPNNAQTLNGDDNASEFAIGKKSQFSEMWNTFQWKGRSLYLTVSQYSKLECASYCLHTTLSETDPSVFFSSQSHVPQCSLVGSREASLLDDDPNLCSKVEHCAFS